MDFREIWEFIKDTSGIIITIVAVVLLKIFIISPITVSGESMKGTFNNDDWIVMEMVTPRFSIKRFDIVVVKYTNPKYIVKRVIALPGDTVEYKDNKLYINDEEMEESFLVAGVITDDVSKTVIPEGHYYLVGDNRGASVDSRSPAYGPFAKKEIHGKVFLKLWPLKEMKIVK